MYIKIKDLATLGHIYLIMKDVYGIKDKFTNLLFFDLDNFNEKGYEGIITHTKYLYNLNVSDNDGFRAVNDVVRSKIKYSSLI